jgi:cytochrome c5
MAFMKKIVAVSLVVFLASCSAKMFVPSDADATRMGAKYPGTTVASLNSGKSLYEAKCSQCHDAKKPTSKTEEQWHKIVPEMAGMARKKGKIEISAEEQDLIIRYLTAAVTKG